MLLKQVRQVLLLSFLVGDNAWERFDALAIPQISSVGISAVRFSGGRGFNDGSAYFSFLINLRRGSNSCVTDYCEHICSLPSLPTPLLGGAHLPFPYIKGRRLRGGADDPSADNSLGLYSDMLDDGDVAMPDEAACESSRPQRCIRSGPPHRMKRRSPPPLS